MWNLLRRRGARVTSPRVSVVIPVYNEGEAIVAVPRPHLRARSRCRARCSSSYDTPEDTTVPVPREVRRARPARACRCSTPTAAGPANAIRFGIDHAQRAGRRRHHGRRQRRPAQIDDARPAGRARRGGRRGVPLHARRPAGRRPAAEGDCCRGWPGCSLLLVRPGRHPRRDQLVQGLLRPTSSARSASSPTPASRSASSWSPRPGGCGCPVAEIPTIWLDRALGRRRTSRSRRGSRAYLRWYRFAFGRRRSPTATELPSTRHDDSEDVRRSKVLVTGSAGFIGGYVVEELLGRGTRSSASTTTRSTARSRKSYDDHPRYRFVEGDARDVDADDRAARRLRPLHRRRRA